MKEATLELIRSGDYLELVRVKDGPTSIKLIDLVRFVLAKNKEQGWYK